MVKNGYYLFVYSEISPLLNALGLSLRHDHNMAVFYKNDSDVRLIAHLEFERFSGKKHHKIAFQNRNDAVIFINRLLTPYNLCLDDFVGVFGIPELTINNSGSNLDYTSILDLPTISYHSVSHLFSSLIMDTEKFYQNDILALSFDGGPDILLDKDVKSKYYFCGAVSTKGKVEYFPIASPGLYWEYISEYFYIQEGTLMALAYATNTRSLESFEDLPLFYGENDRNKVIQAIDKLITRIMSYTEQDCGLLYDNYDYRFTDLENKISIIMKIIQEMSVKTIFQQIDNIIQKYSFTLSDTILALSGGYALNCPTNTKIMHHYHFKEQICCPCVNDGGLSIGMGLYFFYKNCTSFFYRFENAFNGYTDESPIEKIKFQYDDYIENIYYGLDYIATDIEREPIIWLDGRAESGPRALGHRSIIANPQKTSHKDLLNFYKQREWWRPVAPIILEEAVGDFFVDSFRSPFMLNNFKVKQDRKNCIPAVLHLDESARVQTLSYDDNPIMYDIIQRFQHLTGVPIICNTSLNDKGEPITNTIEEALNFALRKNINIIYVNGYRLKLRNHKLYCNQNYLERDSKLFDKDTNETRRVLKELNPFSLSEMELLIYIFNPVLWKYDITKENDINKLKSIFKIIKKNNLGLNVYKSLEKEMKKQN